MFKAGNEQTLLIPTTRQFKFQGNADTFLCMTKLKFKTDIIFTPAFYRENRFLMGIVDMLRHGYLILLLKVLRIRFNFFAATYLSRCQIFVDDFLGWHGNETQNEIFLDF